MKCMKKSAQSLIEYGLILALVAVIAITVLSKFGKAIDKTANSSSTTVNDASNNSSKNYCSGLGMHYEAANARCEDGSGSS